jgi:hypothetical protein
VTKYDVPATPQSVLSALPSSSINTVVGQPVFGVYSYKWGGLTHDTGDPQGYLNGQLSTNWSSIIANTPISGLVFNGPARPTYFGYLRNTFAYRQVSLSFNIIYKLDYYFRKSSISDASTIGSGFNGNIDYLKRWQKPGDEAFTNVPSFQYPPYNFDRENFYGNSSILVDNADNIRLQDIRLSYDFDNLKRKNGPFTHLQVYAYLNNVGILWKANHDGLDPDLYYNGSNAVIPIPRTIAFGVKANF